VAINTMNDDTQEATSLASLASDPNARVMVFIDGQNSYKSCQRLFGEPHVNPRLLALHLAGPRTVNRVACRFYTGRPNPNIPGEGTKAQRLDRRLEAIRKSGVTVVMRPLRYHWDWGHRESLPRPEAGAPSQTVTLSPWQRPQEKGIDVVMALDVIDFVLTGVCDVAIVCSLDRDLAEIPGALYKLARVVTRPFRLEAAVPVAGGEAIKTMRGFKYTHQITPEVFNLVRDATRYDVPEGDWVLPVLPTELPGPSSS
jgi:uncharacterized LabA/DUF88 family protein